jgi:sugar phosphate isomerase/epimerase
MTGSIDWTDVMNALDEIGYCGWYNLEINLRHFGEDFAIEEAAFAVKVMRQILKSHYGEDHL